MRDRAGYAANSSNSRAASGVGAVRAAASRRGSSDARRPPSRPRTPRAMLAAGEELLLMLEGTSPPRSSASSPSIYNGVIDAVSAPARRSRSRVLEPSPPCSGTTIRPDQRRSHRPPTTKSGRACSDKPVRHARRRRHREKR